MGKQTDPAKIGLFIVGAIALLITMILVFSKAEFLKDKQTFVTYFSGSINGLNIGAPIKMKGVPIGRVTNIVAQYNAEASTFLTPVYFEIDMDHIDITHDELFWRPRLDHIEKMIEQGLRAQLNIKSLVTGQLYVELDFYPNSTAHLIKNSNTMEIPAIPSQVEEMKSDLDFFVQELKQIPIGQISTDISGILVKVNHLLESGNIQKSAVQLSNTIIMANQLIKKFDRELGPLLANLNATLSETKALTRNVNQNIKPITQNAEGVLNTMQSTLEQVNISIVSLQHATGQDSPLMYDISQTLQELTKAARSVQLLTDTLERQPDSLIFGKGGQRQ